jgi:hypothetical protein
MPSTTCTCLLLAANIAVVFASRDSFDSHGASYDSFDNLYADESSPYVDQLLIDHDEMEASNWWETFTKQGSHGSYGSAEALLLLDGSYTFHTPHPETIGSYDEWADTVPETSISEIKEALQKIEVAEEIESQQEEDSFDVSSSFGSYNSMATQVFKQAEDASTSPAADAAHADDIRQYATIIFAACAAVVCAAALILKKRAVSAVIDMNDPNSLGEWIIPMGASPGTGNALHDRHPMLNHDASSFV